MFARVRIVLVFGVILIAAFGFAFVEHIRHPRIVGRAVAPDGTEMCVVQECNWDAEPFTTSFVFRSPKEPWGWFYFDHQDLYWGTSRAQINTNTHCATFFRGSAPAVTFDWVTHTYTLHRWRRTMTGAQTMMPDGWSPETPVYPRQ